MTQVCPMDEIDGGGLLNQVEGIHGDQPRTLYRVMSEGERPYE